MKKEKDKVVVVERKKASMSEPQPLIAPPDPTRFGDWTVKGRCIDF